ncbi:MAG: MFS transporter [Candidatus Doudnabacteria bacterium]|nr:MFS transporter [Candidatus Doudnabacteria bacterium]
MISHLRPYIAVLKNVHFTKLWFTQVCTQLTRFILSFAVLLQAFKLTESSLAVSLILVAFGLATVFFGSLAGVYADRFDRKNLLIIITFAQAFIVLGYIPFENNFVALALITFLYSSFNQFYLPAEAPSIPNLVPKEHLLIANSFFSFTANLSMILGFALAAPLTLAFGSRGPFWAAFILMILAGIAALMLPSLKPSEDHEHKALFFKNVWGEFKEGLTILLNTGSVHFSFYALVAVQVYNGMIITLAPAFVSQVLGFQLEKGTLMMILPLASGILLGSLALGWESEFLSKKRMVKIGFAGCGVMTILIAILVGSGNYWLYAILAFIMGIFNTYIFAPSHSLLQEHIDERHRGRIYASLFLLLQLGATLPTVIVGILADNTTIPTILGGLGLVLFFFSFALAIKPTDTTAS